VRRVLLDNKLELVYLTNQMLDPFCGVIQKEIVKINR